MKYFIILALAASFLAPPAFAQESFDNWLNEFKNDALQEGISQDTLDDAFTNAAPSDRVLELDQQQPESTLTLAQYLANTVTEKRIADGKKYLAENRKLLTRIGKKYGVQPRFIVALMGLETSYGRNTGGFNAINALATLAYDGRRSDFFRGELMNALKILQAESMSASEMKGSWAGALGQCQFMPSTYLKYAVDYNRDGKRDIWDTQSDVYASIANYLKALGWNGKQGWGREVILPADFDMSLADITSEKPLTEWKKLGLHNADGDALPNANIQASLIMVGKDSDAVPYLIYGNYKSLLEWNRSRFFATAIGTLADEIEK